jgi:hypothetical protein
MARGFNGSTDKITASNTSLYASGPLTIAAWFYVSVLPGTGVYGGIIAFANNRGIYVHGAPSTGMAYFSGAPGGTRDPGPTTITASVWHHALMTNNGTTAQGYLDGTIEGASFTGGGFSSPVTFTIGNDISAEALNGIIADAAIWNAILTPLEISALAKGVRPNAIRQTSLSLWWPLDGLQSPEVDLSGNKNNGTLTGTTKAFGPPLMMATPRSKIMRVEYIPLPPLMGQICL